MPDAVAQRPSFRSGADSAADPQGLFLLLEFYISIFIFFCKFVLLRLQIKKRGRVWINFRKLIGL